MTEDEFKIEEQKFRLAEISYENAKKQIVEIRKKRTPKFGDIVRFKLSLGTCGLGRYIGEGLVLYVDHWHGGLKKAQICMESDWSNYGNEKQFPTDDQVKEYESGSK